MQKVSVPRVAFIAGLLTCAVQLHPFGCTRSVRERKVPAQEQLSDETRSVQRSSRLSQERLTVRLSGEVVGRGGKRPLEPGGLVHHDECLIFFVAAEDRAFVYLFNADSAGQVELVFPSSSENERVDPGVRLQIPSDECLNPGGRAGEDRMILIASRVPLDRGALVPLVQRSASQGSVPPAEQLGSAAGKVRQAEQMMDIVRSTRDAPACSSTSVELGRKTQEVLCLSFKHEQ